MAERKVETKRNFRGREVLTREAVLAAALALIDEDGLEALSMRRVGEALGVEAMSLYRYVPNKAALLDGVYERILGDMRPRGKAKDWAAHVREQARALRAAFAEHPNAIALFASRPATTTASLERLEVSLAPLRAAGFSPLAALHVVQIVLAYVVGHTMWSIGRDAEANEPAYEALDARAFPHVREIAKKLAGYDPEREFELGLDALIVGLTAAR